MDVSLVGQLTQLLDDPLLSGLLQHGGLLTARLLPLVVLTPVFGGQAVPARFRLALAIVIATSFMAATAPHELLMTSKIAYALLIVKETMVGLTLAIFVLVLFETFAALGALWDRARGSDSTMLYNPTSRQQQTVLGVFVVHLAVVLFLTAGGHLVLLKAMADSLLAISPHAPMPTQLVGRPASLAMISLVSDLFSVAVRLAVPAILVIFVVDIALGLINRMAPQIQAFFLGLTFKGTLAVFLLLASSALLVELFFDEFARALGDMKAFVAARANAA